MANMPYCRFANTLKDLRECMNSLCETQGDLSGLTRHEAIAAQELIDLCKNISDFYADDDEVN